MSDGATRRKAEGDLSIRTLRVTVTQGPDAGRTIMPVKTTVLVGSAADNDLVLTDPWVSRYHLELAAVDSGIALLDTGSTNGTFVGTVRVRDAILAADTRLRVGDTELVVSDGARATLEVHESDRLGRMFGNAPAMRRLMAELRRVATTEASVLLHGESGTGKELAARAIHELGPRAGGPFVTIDCGALPPMLVASELFGHERGAFTGADRQHIGLMEQAQGGTLFIDEIGELPAPLQATLLGAIERRVVRRVGGKKPVPLDVRIVCATHRDLRAQVNSGEFRQDLYYRLAVVTLRLPPLRERVEDIAPLVEHFLHACGCDGPLERYFSAAALESLRHHHWPGNVRELRNLIEATAAMGVAQVPHLDGAGSSADLLTRVLPLPYKDARAALLAEFEGRYLRALIDRAEGNVSRASREGRINRSHLIDLLQRHGIRTTKD